MAGLWRLAAASDFTQEELESLHVRVVSVLAKVVLEWCEKPGCLVCNILYRLNFIMTPAGVYRSFVDGAETLREPPAEGTSPVRRASAPAQNRR